MPGRKEQRNQDSQKEAEAIHKQELANGSHWPSLPTPTTPRENKWMLVPTDHFTRLQDALTLPDATASVVANAMDEQMFYYLGLPEQIYTDKDAQFKSQLMAELCQLWNVEKTHTTPYHPQANGIVERNNRRLEDSLQVLLLARGQDE